MSSDKAHKQNIINYYVNTKREYRFIWRTNRHLGIHFGYYDKDNSSHDSAILNLNRKLAELARISADDRILDAGCGIGGSAIWLAETYGCHVTGVNIVPWQITQAQLLAKQRHLDKLLDFHLADYSATGLKNVSFSIIWALESIVHAADKQAVINEAFRVLRPGGKLIICEYMLNNTPLSREQQAVLNRWLNGWAMPSLLTEQEYRTFAVNAGFKPVTFYDWTTQVEPSFKRLKRFVTLMKPIASMLYKLHLINKGQLANLDASDAQMESFDADLWRYKVIVARKP